MATERRFLSTPRDRRHLLSLVAMLLGLGELVDAFFISFWEAGAVFCILFLVAAAWNWRGRIGGAILAGALCVFELQSFPTWARDGLGDWISQIAFVVVSAAGLAVAVAVLLEWRRSRTASGATRHVGA
jgi:hypothetical protein